MEREGDANRNDNQDCEMDCVHHQFGHHHLQATVWRRAVAFGSIENEVLLNCMTTAYQKGDQWVQVH